MSWKGSQENNASHSESMEIEWKGCQDSEYIQSSNARRKVNV